MPEEPTQPWPPRDLHPAHRRRRNAFSILGRTARALREAGLPKDEVDQYYAEATSGDYDHLLQTTMAGSTGSSRPVPYG